jgi:hypothetical protein
MVLRLRTPSMSRKMTGRFVGELDASSGVEFMFTAHTAGEKLTLLWFGKALNA